MVAACNASFAGSLFFQPSRPSPAWGLGTHYEAESYRGLFCGNDGINNFDVNGNSWLSKQWDHTILKIGQQAAINWDHGRQDVELGAAIVASVFVGWEVAGLVDQEILAATYDVTFSQAASLTGISALETTTSIVASGVAGGAAGGFVSGTSLAAISGQHLGVALKDGLKGAEYGALQGGIAAGTNYLNSDLGFSSAPALNLKSPGQDLYYVGLKGIEGAVTQKLYDKDASVGFWSGIASGFSSIATPKNWYWEATDLEKGVLGGLSSLNKEGKGFMTGFWSATAKAVDDQLNAAYKDDSPWVKYPAEIATNAMIQGSVGRFGGKDFSAGLFSGGTSEALSLSLGELENGNPEKGPSETGPTNSMFKLLTPKMSHGHPQLPLNSISGGYWALGAPWDQL